MKLPVRFHGVAHPLRMSELITLASNRFTAKQITQQESRILVTLKWTLRPVTAYEVMNHCVLYAKLPLQNEVIKSAETVIDFSLCGECLLAACFVCSVMCQNSSR